MKARNKIRSVIVLLVVVGVAWGAQKFLGIDLLGAINVDSGGSTAVVVDSNGKQPAGTTDPLRDDDALIVRSFENERSDVMVESGGTVKKVLRDDNEGSRHQRFIVRLGSGHTVLIAHNIDLAPRVPLREGDAVRFHGEYEWGGEGGVVHWTHHDPAGRHEGGWIEHAGRRYE